MNAKENFADEVLDVLSLLDGVTEMFGRDMTDMGNAGAMQLIREAAERLGSYESCCGGTCRIPAAHTAERS